MAQSCQRQNDNTSRKQSLFIKAIFLSLAFIGNSFFIPSAHAAFQENLWGARPAGMAGAFTALADDSNAPAYNPAGISLLSNNEVTFMYAQLFTGIDLHAGDESTKLGLGYFSFVPSIRNKQYGSYAVSWSNFQATNLLREDTLSLTYADSYVFENNPNKPIFAYGTNLKYLKRQFSTDKRSASDPVFKGGQGSNAYTFDLGFMYKPNFLVMPGLKLGLALQNITRPDMGLHETDRVPSKYTLGIAYQDRRYRLFNPALDISRREGRTLASLAWEGWMAKDTLALRLGGNQDEIGGGMGYQFRLFDQTILRFDYSLLWPLNVDQTNGNHRVSITMNF